MARSLVGGNVAVYGEANRGGKKGPGTGARGMGRGRSTDGCSTEVSGQYHGGDLIHIFTDMRQRKRERSY